MTGFIGQYFPELVVGAFSLFAVVLAAASISDNLKRPVR